MVIKPSSDSNLKELARIKAWLSEQVSKGVGVKDLDDTFVVCGSTVFRLTLSDKFSQL